MPRFEPPPPTPEQEAQREAERKHTWFAGIVIFGIMLLLPILGAIAVKLGFFDVKP